MPDLIPVLSAQEIDVLVSDLAQRISSDYHGRELVLVGVLKGAFIFLSDLVRKLTIPVKIDFVQAASYGSSATSCGQIRLAMEIGVDIKGCDILLVEDIVDTGITVGSLLDYLRSFQPRSVAVCALINKRERREREVPVAYIGRGIEKGFLVGYGLDYAEDYRHLPGIFHLKL